MKKSITAATLALAMLGGLWACDTKLSQEDVSIAHTKSATLAPDVFQTLDMVQAALAETAAENLDDLRDDNDRPLSYAMLGQRIPDFDLPLHSGGRVTQDTLKNKWTVIGFWGAWCSDCLADAPYKSALMTALEQDPDVGYLAVHTPPSPTRVDEAFGKWGSMDAYQTDKGLFFDTAIDADASAREAFQIAWTPTYLLVAPDLTAFAFRTDLSVSGDDGVKDTVRQISRLRGEWKAAQLEGPAPTDSAQANSISRAGVAAMSGQTRFEPWALEKAFDGYDVIPSEDMFEGETFPIFEVRDDNGVVFFVYGDTSNEWVHSVVTRRPEVKGPRGETIGVTRLGDLPTDVLGECNFGLERYQDALFCSPDDVARFVRVFRLPEDYAGLADNATNDIRAQAVLIELTYLPERPLPN